MTATGTLWIVATPIGSIDDLGVRAGAVLAEVDLILAEDTRRTRKLLSHIEVQARGRVRSLHEHNEHRVVPRVVRALEEGRSAALVSDAGTPVLSDPGFLLVRAVRGAGLKVCSVPGASAFTAALAASGQPPLPATMVGFLPARAAHRRRRVADLAIVPWTIVVLLSPHRIQAELADLAQGLGADRPATLLAELSKVYERAVTGSLAELAGGVDAATPKGEYVVVVGPAPEPAKAVEASVAEACAAYRQALAESGERRQALRRAAQDLGVSRRHLYSLLVEADREP